MKHFLLEYHRPSRRLRTLIEYADGREAMEHRFALERENNPDIEPVVLSAESLDVIKQTHSRYFSGPKQRRNPNPSAE
jgi:hypothetical protein